MITTILGFLTAIAPLITSVGLGLINLFVSNAADKKQAQLDFLQAQKDHIDDALKSVNARFSDKKQNADLDAQLAKLDAEADQKPKP